MKRTAATFVMVAGLGGCVSPGGDKAGEQPKPFGQATLGKEVPGVKGPAGEPVHVAAGQMPTGKEKGAKVTRADHMGAPGAGSGIEQTAGFLRLRARAHVPGVASDSMGGCADGSCGGGLGGHTGHGLGGHHGGGMDPMAYGPMVSPLQSALGRGGILPVPGMGPAGAVALAGVPGGAAGGMYGPLYANQRTSVRFANPAGMKVTWQGPGGAFVEPAPLEAPVRYNFAQGNVYRLRLSGVPTRPGKVYYPTLEVYPATPNTVTFLSHSTVPVAFTDEDFEQVNAGNLVVKVIYLPFPQFQDLAAVGGLEEVVSTRLEPGVNPVEEANRRGTILAVIRMGNIDLQDPNTPAMDAPPGMMPGAPAAPINPAVPGAVMSPPPTMAPPAMTVPGSALPPITAPAPLPPSAVKTPAAGTTTSRPSTLPTLP